MATPRILKKIEFANSRLRRELWIFFLLDACLSHGNIVGVTKFTREVYGVPIFATVTKRYLN
jgi:hypothetical protein